MRSLVPAVAATLVATAALPGGIDQSGQPVTLVFQEGDYAELTLGYVMPRISAEGGAPGTTTENAYGDLPDFSGGIKRRFGERLSAAVIVDQPYGVIVNYDLDYPAGGFAYAGTSAEPRSLGVTGLLRYAIAPHWSLHGGLRAIRFGGEATLRGWGFGPALDGYSWEGDDAWGLGYVAGVAYEVPEIALRVALTYGSRTELTLDSVETHVLDPATGAFGTVRSETAITMPQSVNLDFQTGVAADTLLYGSVRWVAWKDWTVAPPGLALVTGGVPLVRLESDVFTYRLGLGRQFTETVAGAFEVAHETGRGADMTALDPYDGYTALSVGGTYAMASGLELSGGLSYSFLGDAETEVNGARARFDGNDAVSAAVRVGWRF